MNCISSCSARARAYLAVLLLGMMEWISTRYHILSSGQKSCDSSKDVRHAGKHSSKARLCRHIEGHQDSSGSLRQSHTSACLPLSCGTMSLYVSNLPVGRGESAALAELTGISCMQWDASDRMHVSEGVGGNNKAL